MLTPQELAAEITGLAARPPTERARAAKALIDAAKATLSAVRREAIHEATREMSYGEVARALGISVSAVNAAVSGWRAAGRSTPSRVRRAQERRHRRERDPQTARRLVAAEVLARDPQGVDVHQLIDSITASWLARGEAGYRDGLRGWVNDQLRR